MEALNSFSLPTQRCFYHRPGQRIPWRLFSAYAEVFLERFVSGSSIETFLCLRRGVSGVIATDTKSVTFSLPTQRCFPQARNIHLGMSLFSAYAEVFPGVGLEKSTSATFLCLRRGVSDPSDEKYPFHIFSLPTQRCF